MRIVSLCPSNTEILFAIGAGKDVVAVEKWSDYPPETADLPSVGSEMDVDMDLVASHEPDLVLASLSVPGMERTVEALKKKGIAYLVLNPQSLEDIFRDLETVGKAVGQVREAEKEIHRMRGEIELLRTMNQDRKIRADVYIEWWPKPAITPGCRCWTRDMIEIAGGVNIFEDQDFRSGEVTYQEVAEKNPDLILLCWCGIPIEKIDTESAIHREGWQEITAVKEGKVFAVEEGFYGRPGPRALSGIRQMAEWIAAMS